MMVAKLLLYLNVLWLTMALEDQDVCPKNRSLFEIPGDAVLSLFLDINHGPYCNITSTKGLQEASTAFYVVHALNKYEFVPELSIGIKVYDTCRDEMTVYKQALQAAVDTDCVDNYDLGILLDSGYAAILEPFRNYSVLPITTYKEQNLTRPLINLMVHYLTTRFETIDLLLVDSDFPLNLFLDTTKEAGLCVKRYSSNVELDENDTEAVVAVIGGRNEIRQWIEKGEKLQGPKKTWIVLPIGGSNVDDLIPSGSYVIRTPSFDSNLLQEISSTDDFLEAAGETVIHSSHLLGVGKAIVEVAQVLQDLQKRNCPRAMEQQQCVMPRFNPNSGHEIRNNNEVYHALRILPKLHSIKYIAAMKSQQELVDIATYRVEPSNVKFRVIPESRVPKMPKLCLKKYAKNCESCLNFKKRFGPRGVTKDTLDRGLLKSGSWIPIFLTVVVCGTFACGVIAAFIIYRFLVEDVLDGNPALTIVLILADVFTLLTVLPFCMNDGHVGAEALNARKILVVTLAFGVDFSVMLSRAFFLVFSKGGVFTAHINGYLQGLMVFFMFGVQIAISIMYFVLGGEDSAVIVRSLVFIGLLGYDIFLLVTLFVVCFFIAQLPRNYREGKCFFGTSIGLLITWAIWLTCFILVEPECRDMVVCFGIIGTAYLIIIGVLIPRTYYMVTHLARGKEFSQRFGSMDLTADPRINTITRQSRPFYDYVHTGVGSTTNLHVASSAYPNYYGSSSPNQKYLSHCRSPDSRRNPGYNNYGFHTEMREVNNSYTIPQVCIENADSRTNTVERSTVNSAYARPKCHRKRRSKDEKSRIETDVYAEGNLAGANPRNHDEIYPIRSSSPRMAQMEATIREEDEEDEPTRITRF
ncbi:PREDICTED: protein bride of sevenless [Dufourea novaeangliae]|uniref:Protein bride of sevenless n=1 Tax=Dufourea novaeangliae TaxID=178035 RepID=A0A154NVP3_DUFNO|nr:PREDICTED: protein bride of sevenless [Dufourea novaeangliae]KZC03736.1 Protein bride of sevenless [Dufourea novaeangliae]